LFKPQVQFLDIQGEGLQPIDTGQIRELEMQFAEAWRYRLFTKSIKGKTYICRFYMHADDMVSVLTDFNHLSILIGSMGLGFGEPRGSAGLQTVSAFQIQGGRRGKV
jgi:hypothetical protein